MPDQTTLQNLERLMRWRVEIDERKQGFIRHPSNHHCSEKWFQTKIVDCDLWFIVEGAASLEGADGERYPLERGTFVFLRPGLCRRVWQEAEAQRLALTWFHFRLYDIATSQLVPAEEVASFPLTANGYNVETIELLCMQILHLGLSKHGAQAARSKVQDALAGETLKCFLFHLLLGSSHFTVPTSPSNIKRHRDILGLLEVIEMNPSLFLSVKEMAQSCGLAQSYFTRLFTQIVGKPPITVMIEARIRKAKQFLDGSNLTVSQIADELGYKNTYFFYRQFKKLTKMTPMEFRTRDA